MKKLIIWSAFFAVILGLQPTKMLAQASIENNFVHTVLFWFHEPDNEKHRKAFEKSLSKFMENSKYVGTYHIGRPANTPREVVDNSYTYKLTVTFPDKEHQDKYQAEKVHEVFIEESKQYWKAVKVFDSISIERPD